MAIQPSKLIIAFLALAIICLAGWIMDLSKTVVATPNTQGQETELQIYMTNPNRLKPYIENYKEKGEYKGVFSTLWHFTSTRFKNAVNLLFAFNLPAVAANIAECFKAAGWALRYHFIYCIIFFAIGLAVISIAGGSICRIAALRFARGEKPGLTEALRFSARNFTNFFTAPLAPICIIIFIALFIFLLGLIGNIPIAGELIIGLFAPLALIAGSLIAVISIGMVAGFNLMFPAVAYDGSDCFDAISRSFSLGVWVENGKQVNKLTAIWPEPTFMNLSGSSDLAAAGWSQPIAAFLVYLFLLVVVGLVVSFVISFYFSANTIIYSLMRNRVDNTALEDIYTYFNDVKTEPATPESGSEESQPESETQDD